MRDLLPIRTRPPGSWITIGQTGRSGGDLLSRQLVEAIVLVGTAAGRLTYTNRSFRRPLDQGPPSGWWTGGVASVRPGADASPMPEPIPVPPSLAGHTARLLAFRINRRPIGEGTLIPEELPPDAFDHFVRMLAPGYEVKTFGRGHERAWRVGGIEVDREEQFVTGKLGWSPTEPEGVPSWSEELKDWPLDWGGIAETLMPFAFDGKTRLLGVVHDKRSTAPTVASVFELILDGNERESDRPTTQWSVEPVLDAQEFIDWLHSLDTVQSVGFVASLPNPEPMAAFEDLWRRMADAHGTEYSARMKSEREEGLKDIEQDQEFRQAIAMGEQGFAKLDGRGRKGGKKSTYSQSNKVAHEQIPRLPADWEEMRTLLKDLVRTRLRRFLQGEDEAA